VESLLFLLAAGGLAMTMYYVGKQGAYRSGYRQGFVDGRTSLEVAKAPEESTP